MKYALLALLIGAVLLTQAGMNSSAVSQEATSSPKAGGPSGVSASMLVEKKYEDFSKVTQGAKEYDGLFKLYQKDDRVYAEIQN